MQREKFLEKHKAIRERMGATTEAKNADWRGSLNVVPVAEDGIMIRSAR